MKRSIVAFLMGIIIVYGLAWAEDYRQNQPYDQYGKPNYRYKGSSGTDYQYDLSKPNDKLLYGIDLKAQMNDKLSVDPRRNIDHGLGQHGGGIKR
jgi:hypothetical protein